MSSFRDLVKKANGQKNSASYKQSTYDEDEEESNSSFRDLVRKANDGTIKGPTTMNSTDVNNWFTGVKTTSKSAYEYLSQEGYKQPNTAIQGQIDGYLAQADYVGQYLRANKNSFKDYESVYQSYVDTVNYLQSLQGHTKTSNDYYSQFKTEGEYEAYALEMGLNDDNPYAVPVFTINGQKYTIDDLGVKLDDIDDAKNDLDLIFQVNQSNIPIDGYGYTDDPEKRRQYENYYYNMSVLWEKYGKDKYATVEDFYYGEFYTNAGINVIHAAEERANEFAITTPGGKNYTWQGLYDQASARRNLSQNLEMYSTNADWAENSQAIVDAGDARSDYTIAHDVASSTIPLDKEHAMEDGYSEERYNSYMADRQYLQDKYGEKYGIDFLSDPYADYSRLLVDLEKESGAKEGFYYFNEMTDSEREVFSYIYQTQGREAAVNWYQNREWMYKERRHNEVSENAAYFGEHYPVFGSALSIATNIAAGAEYVGDILTGDNYNTSAAVTTGIRSGVQQVIDWEIAGWDVGDFLYSTAMSGVDSITATTMFGGWGGAMSLGLGAAAQGTNDAIERGLSKDQAFWTGLSSGVFEMVFERISIGNFKALKDIPATTWKAFAKNLAKTMLVNASEETLTEIANIAYDTFFNGDLSQYETMIRQYESQGMSTEEARRRAVSSFTSQIIEAGASGALMGLGFGVTGSAGSIAYNTAAYRQSAKHNKAIAEGVISTDGGVASLQALANEVAGVSSPKMQNTINKRSAAVEKNASEKNVRKLYKAVGAATDTQSKADIIKVLEQDGIRSRDAKVIAEAMLKDPAGFEAAMTGLRDESTFGKVNQRKYANQYTEILRDYWDNKSIDYAFNNIAKNSDSTIGQRNQRATQFVQDIAVEMVKKNLEEVAADATKQKAIATEFTPKGNYEVSEDNKAIDTKTGDAIDIKGVYAVKEGKMILETADGKTVDAKDVSFANGNDALIYEAVADMGDRINAETANKLIAQYKGGDAMVFARGITEAYSYGYWGINKSELMSNKAMAAKLTKEQRNAAYQLGEQYRPVKDQADKAMARLAGKPGEKGVYYRDKNGNAEDIQSYLKRAGKELTPVRKTAIEAMEKLSAAMGVRFNVYETWQENGVTYYLNENGVKVKGNPNGFYDTKTGEIYIDLNAGNDFQGTMLFTAAHELTHFLRQWSPEHFTKIAKIVFDSAGMKGRVSDLAAKQQAKAKANGRDISFDEALEEVVADGMETILKDGKVLEFMAEVKQQDQTAWEKIKEWFKNFAESLKKLVSAYSGFTADSTEGQLVADAKDILNQIEQVFAEGALVAGENYQQSLTPGKEGTIANENGEPVAHSTADGTVQLSMRTYEESGREAFRNYLQKCVTSKKLTKAEMTEMLDGIEEIYNTCKEFKDKYAPFGTWSDAAVVRDTYGKPVFSVVTPNGDYKMNLDFSLVCKKRRALDAVFNEMSKRGIIDDFELGQKSVVKINEIIRKHGFETACALCFVDAKRFRQASMADSFTSLYNELVRSLVPESQQSSIGSFNFAGYDTIQKVENGIDTWDNSKLDFSHIAHVMKTYGDGTVEYKAAKYIKTHPEGRKLLLRGDFMSSQGFDAVKAQNPDVLKLYNSKKGTGGPKAAFGDVQYMNEVIQKARWWTPAKAYAVGGVRVQSFSDYVPRMVFDYVQMIYDLAATKLPAHAYTKEALFVKQFGLTGIKINMSLIPAIADGGIAPGLDANGNYVWAGESFDFETAKEIQNAEGYTENCGTICVGVSDLHIRKLLNDPNIRQVIPYHKSGLNPIVAHMNRIAQFKDYTGSQNTLDQNGSKVEKDFDFNQVLHKMGENGDPKAVVDQYLEWCDSKGYTPKFSQFRDNPNYYKLIEDFTLYDANDQYVPQREVRAVFPTKDSAFGSMKDLINEGLQEDAIIEGKRDASLSSIVDEIQQTLPKTEAEIEEQEVEQADRDLEAGAKFSTREEFPEEINQWKRRGKPDDESFVLGSTGDVIQGLGAIESDIYMLGEKINTIMDKHPEITVDEIKKIPQILENPVLILESQNTGKSGRNTRMVVFGSVKAKNGLPVTAILDLRPVENHLVIDDMQKVTSAYTKDNNPVEFVSRSKVLYADKKRATSLLRTIGFQTPIELNKSGFVGSVTYVGQKVKMNGVPFAEVIGETRYSDRDTESVSNRSLLANAFEGVAQNDIERNKIQEYKSKIDLINSEEQKLRELNEQIKELSFAKGPRDTAKIRELQFEAKQTANRIGVYDKQLLRLEASKPLQDVLNREKKMAYQRAEQKGKEALAAYREKAAKTQRELLDRYRDSRKKAVEGREKTAVRHKIQRVVGELNDLLLHEDKKHHVPDSLKKAVADALSLVNMDTVGAEERAAKYAALIAKETDPDKIDAYTVTMENILRQGEKMGKRLKELRDAYEDIATSDDPDIANGYDPVISASLKELAESIGNTSLRDMSIDQLQDVYDMYKMVLTRVRDANKSLIDSIKETITNRASRVVGEVRRAGGEHKVRASALDPVRAFSWNNLKPVYAMERIGSATMTEAYNNVRKGEDTWAQDVVAARAYYIDKSKKYGYDSWDFEKKYRFKSVSGQEFDLTLEQILSLYAYSKRDQAGDHLKLGGFVFDSNIETYKEKGSKLVKYKVNTADAHQISPEILTQITGTLTKEQTAFVDEMQDYLSTVMGAKGNEVTMKMYGVKLFKEKFYFPLKSARQFMFEQNEVSGEVRIKNSGFTNKTKPKANNPVILNNFMDVWANHVNDMSMYHAFVLPLEDFNRIFNYNSPKQEGKPPVSVKGTIQSAYSPAAVSYVKQLITDLNGGAMSDPRETFAKAMTAKFKKAKVFSSLSVVIQQPSAIGRAFAEISPKYFHFTKDGMNHDQLWAELKQYAPVAVIKEMGYFDTNMGKSTQDFIKAKEYTTFKEKAKAIFADSGYRDEKLSRLPALADEITWCSIWNAVKRETVAKHHDLSPRSEEFLKIAGERFTEVVTKTQVYDSVLARSANMRSKSGLMSMATSFMAEPTTAINMLGDAIRKAKRGDKGYAAKAFASVATSIILNNALVALVYGMRDDDEDETFLEKYAQSFVSNMIDDLNPITYYPFLKDMWSLLQGYSVERSDMSLVSDLADTAKAIIQAYASEDGDVAGAWWDFAGAVANIGGIPMQNIRRDVNGVINFYNTLRLDVNGRTSTWKSMGDAVASAVRDSTPILGWLPGDTKSDNLYDAIISGDKAYADRLRGSYESEAAYHNAVRKALRENDPRIRAAAQAQIDGDPSERVRIAKEIIADGFNQDDVVAAINAEIISMTPKAETSGTKVKGFYTAEDFAREWANGDRASANAAREDIIATAKKNGKTQEEAEESFVSSATSELKTLFLNGEISESKTVDALAAYCGKTEDEALADVQYWAFKRDYPDVYADDQWFDTYYEKVADSGISIDVYMDYRNTVASITGEGKKERRMAVIHSLPITTAQKDALYYAEGWSKSTLYEAPWH